MNVTNVVALEVDIDYPFKFEYPLGIFAPLFSNSYISMNLINTHKHKNTIVLITLLKIL